MLEEFSVDRNVSVILTVINIIHSPNALVSRLIHSTIYKMY